MADGVGSMRMLGVMFDLAREGDELGEMPPVPSTEVPPWWLLSGGVLGGRLTSSVGLVRRTTAAAVPKTATECWGRSARTRGRWDSG